MQYCWDMPGQPQLSETFDTVEAAEQGAKNYWKDTHEGELRPEITISEVDPITVRDYAGMDMVDLLERMDEAIGVVFDDPVFEVDDEKEAQADLDRVITAWAEKWVHTSDQYITGKTVKIIPAEVSDRERELMLHALGSSSPQAKLGSRNYFSAEPGSDDEKTWASLVGRGLADRGRVTYFSPGTVYAVTDVGKRALGIPLSDDTTAPGAP